MSILTSTPSPAASPRSSFHIPRNTYTAPSPRSTSSARGTQYAAASPTKRHSWHEFGPRSASGSRQPREHYVESPIVEKRPRFVDAGTQYSPDGYPPTAGRRVAEKPSGSVAQQKHKRKERERSESPQAMSMSGDVSSSGSSAPRQPPPEPDPRIDPSASAATQGSNAAVAGPSNHQHQQEAQEARSTHGHSSAPKRSRPEAGSVKVMPLLYQNCNSKDLGVLISNMLIELLRLNDPIPLRDGRLTRFHSRAPPGISVSDYLQRLIHHATLSPPILLSMVWYIDRLCSLYPAFTINSLTVHRFLITAATVAAKGLSDSFWTNPTYARIGGIPVSELATLELDFLEKVQWKIVPKPETLEEYYCSLVERIEGYELERAPRSESGSTSVGESDEGDGEVDGEKEDEEMVDEPT